MTVNVNGGLAFGAGITAPSLGALAGTGNLALNTSDALAVNLAVGGNNANSTYFGSLSGSGGLLKQGSGTFTLGGSSSFTGGTTVSAGAVQLANSGALVNSGLTVNAANGLTFATGTTAPQIGSLSGSGNIALTDGTNPVILSAGGNNQSTTYSGGLSGAGGLAKAGSGLLALAGSNTYGGGTTISAGTLAVGSGTSGSISGGVTNNALLAFNRSDSSAFAGNISGSGGLVQMGGGILLLTGSNTYQGSTTISNGTIRLSAAGQTAPGGAAAIYTFNNTSGTTSGSTVYNDGSLSTSKSATLSGERHDRQRPDFPLGARDVRGGPRRRFPGSRRNRRQRHRPEPHRRADRLDGFRLVPWAHPHQ